MAIQINTIYPIFGGTLDGTNTKILRPYLEYDVKSVTPANVLNFDKDIDPNSNFELEKEIYKRATFINPKNNEKIVVYIFMGYYAKIEKQILQELSERWGL